MSQSNVTIRKACASDCLALEKLYAELTGNCAVRVLPERIETISADPGTYLLVCEFDEQVCATVLVSLCADAMFGHQPFAVVENLIVTKAVRGSGIGKQLMAHIEAYCLNQDCSKMMLLSSAIRTEAHQFFEKSGFASDTKRGFVKYRRQFDDLKVSEP